MHNKHWNPAECDYVRANYRSQPPSEMATHLGRTRIAVYNKANDLGCYTQTAKQISQKTYDRILCEEWGVGPGQLTWHQQHSRKHKYSHRRWRAWRRLREMGYSTTSIGRCAGRDHGTVILGSRKAGFVLGQPAGAV